MAAAAGVVVAVAAAVEISHINYFSISIYAFFNTIKNRPNDLSGFFDDLMNALVLH